MSLPSGSPILIPYRQDSPSTLKGAADNNNSLAYSRNVHSLVEFLRAYVYDNYGKWNVVSGATGAKLLSNYQTFSGFQQATRALE